MNLKENLKLLNNQYLCYNSNSILKTMSVIIYQEHCDLLEKENEELLKEVLVLRRKVKYYETLYTIEGDKQLRML